MWCEIKHEVEVDSGALSLKSPNNVRKYKFLIIALLKWITSDAGYITVGLKYKTRDLAREFGANYFGSVEIFLVGW